MTVRRVGNSTLSEFSLRFLMMKIILNTLPSLKFVFLRTHVSFLVMSLVPERLYC